MQKVEVCNLMQYLNKMKDITYKKNIYINDYIIRISQFMKNIAIEKEVNRFKSIDSIESIQELETEVNRVIKSKMLLYNSCFARESLLYGHIDSLYHYAGLGNYNPIYLPKVEHGVNFTETSMARRDLRICPNLVFQGEYKKKMIHSLSPLTPVFSVGPYIHYASHYYSKSLIEKIKKQYGKTLLVFPPHSYEKSSMDYDMKNFVDYVMKKYGNSYKTILVSSYWLNLNSPIYKMFTAKGAKVVSAGARFDPNFIRRLKTIISISDKVVCNDIGTHIGYSVYMGKPVEIIKTKIEKKDATVFSSKETSTYSKNYELFYDAFGEHGSHSENLQKELYIKFWGGNDIIRTPEEIVNIVKISEKILKYSNGNINQYHTSVKKLLKELSSSKRPDDRAKFILLEEAINSIDL